ncbi:hypothetical protein ERJ77_22935, partial [Vibrio anguillarum]|nr:hypothetical protein [Vibrio anguillarum]
MKLKHISGWLLIALAIYVYLKETAFGYWMYIANQTNSGGISFSMYLPFGLFALGAFIIGLGMY